MVDKIKVYTVGSRHDSAWINNTVNVANMNDADVVVFPGGSDWNPALYKQKPSKTVYSYEDIDAHQLHYYISAYYQSKMLVGICRGAQLFGIASGGSLIQDVSHHCGRNHSVITLNKKVFQTNSIHHQMLNWDSIDIKKILLAWSDGLSSRYFDGNDTQIAVDKQLLVDINYKEPEAFFFNDLKAFGIQGHPEGHMPDPFKEQLNTWFTMFYNRYQNKPNTYNEIIEKRIDLIGEVYPELKPIIKLSRELSTVVKPVAPSLIVTKSLPPTFNTTENETNRNFSTTERIWGD
jgi:anthranilate/para-aminobenzoate synthase component II